MTKRRGRDVKPREFILTCCSMNGYHLIENLEEVIDGVRWCLRFVAMGKNYNRYEIKLREVKPKQRRKINEKF